LPSLGQPFDCETKTAASHAQIDHVHSLHEHLGSFGIRSAPIAEEVALLDAFVMLVYSAAQGD
jgi:hypothetical protein